MSEKKYIGIERIIHTSKPFHVRNNLATKIDDKVLVVDNTKSALERIITAIIAIIAICYSLYDIFYPLGRDRDIADYVGITFCVIVILVCIVVLINIIINTERKFIFNRLEGTITMRSSVLNWRPSTVTVRFDEACINFFGRFSHVMKIVLPNAESWNLNILGTTGTEDDIKCISFFTWYMDKNRPLPLGEDLDAYRQADYLRRKAEGFPPPLFPSLIPMKDYDGDTSRYGKVQKF